MPSGLLIYISLLVVVIVTSTLTRAQELIDHDTVSIEAGETDEELPLQLPIIHRIKRQSLKDGLIVTINCKTARNEEGHCKPFKECYPLFRLRDDDEDKSERDEKRIRIAPIYELESIYRNISGPCDESLLAAIEQASASIGKNTVKKDYVCCPIGKKPISTTKPSRPPAPTSNPNTMTNNCGKVLVDFKSDFNLTEDDTQVKTENYWRIVNGRLANRGEFPFQIALMSNNNRPFCGGSLISDSHVLTAAHCVYYMNRLDVSRMRIHLGDHNLYSTQDGPHEVRSASNIYYHKGFNMNTLYDDISVIRLSKPVTFSKFIQPVCLSTGSPRYDTGNTYADVTGWGQLSDKGPQSSVLRTVSVRVMTQDQCKSAYRGKAPAGIVETMVCAGGDSKDSCKGDSGGPLTIHNRSQTTQIGIVSWGIGCASFPGVYSRVDKFLSWINKNKR